MAEFKPIEVKVEGLEDIRRLSAALEQYNEGDALRAELDRARAELASAYNIIQNRTTLAPGAAFKTDLLSEIAGLVDRDVRREIGSDHAATKQQLAEARKVIDIAEGEIEQVRALLGIGKLCPVGDVLRAVDAIQVDRKMQQHTIEGLRGRLYELSDQISRLERAHDQHVDALKKARAGAAEYKNDATREAARRIELEKRAQRLEADLNKARKVIEFADEESRKIREALGLSPLAGASDVIAAMGYPDTLNGIIKELRDAFADAQDEIAASEADLDRVRARLDDQKMIVRNVLTRLSDGKLSTNGAIALIQEAVK